MEKPPIELVVQALETFSRDHDPAEQQKASKWLEQLQRSVHAWEVADQLLALKGSQEASYFAAQTMQSKIRHNFDELPPQTHTALRDSLLNHLQTFCTEHHTITRQLAVALADLALQVSQWSTVVPDLIQRFGSNVSTVGVLLDVLIVLPEETYNRSLRLGETRRKELRQLLSHSCTDVLSLLVACLNSYHDSNLLTKLYNCLGSWVHMGTFPVHELAQSPLVQAPFQTLTQLEVPSMLYDAATDSICAMLYVCEDVQAFFPLALVLKSQVEQMRPLFQAAVQIEDSDRSICLCRIFTEMCESFLYYLTIHPNSQVGDLRVLEWLLECVAHPEYEVAEITFNLWYRLSEELLKMECVENARIFKPYIAKLISHLCVHCRLDEDTNKDTVPGEKEEFVQFRTTVKEVLRDVIFIVGSLEVFGDLYTNICKPNLSWNENEACLFVMHAVAPSIRTDESKLLPIAVPVLLSIPPDTHCAVRATTLGLIGGLAEWIDSHHDVLDTVLQFILDGLKIQSVASHAAKAVQKVCQKCRKRMAPHFDGLLQIIQSADQLSVSNDAIVGLLKGAAEVLSQLPHEKVTAGMRGLVQLQITPLLELTQSSHLGKVGTSGDPALWMDRLTALFRSCSIEMDSGQQSHPCQPVVEELWPVIAAVVTTYQSDDKIMERTCRCVRFILRCLGKFSYSILTPLVELAIQVYKSHHQSCFLYLGSIIVDEFGSDPNYQQGLLFMLVAFAEVSFPLLSGPTGLIDNPDTIDDIFRLCSRFIQHVPETFLASPVASASIQCALAASVLDHRDAFSSVMKFFRDLLTLGKNGDLIEADKMQRQAVVSSFIAEHGATIMDRLVQGYVTLPTYMLTESTEVLWTFLEQSKEVCMTLLQSSIEKLPVRSTMKVMADQQTAIILSVSRCDDVEKLYPVIKDLARLYR